MELTKFCVELVIDCRMVLCRVFGMFCAVLWHVLWPQLGGYCGRWTRAVPGWFRVKMVCTGAAKELPGTLLHG